MVAEVETQTAPQTTPDLVPSDELTAGAPEGQPEGVTGPEGEVQGQEAEPTLTPALEPTEQEQLDAAIAVREAASRGEAARALTDREKVLLRVDDDRRITYENMARDAVERQRATARELANAHATARSGVIETFNEVLKEAEVELSASQAKLLDKTIQEKFEALEANSARVNLVPLLTYAAESLFDIVDQGAKVTKDLYPKATSSQVRQHFLTLPVVSSDGSPSLMSEAYRAGWAARNRQGPTPGSQSFTTAELAAHDKAIRQEELGKVRQGGQPGNQGSDGAKGASGLPTIQEWQSWTLERREEARRKDPDIEATMVVRR